MPAQLRSCVSVLAILLGAGCATGPGTPPPAGRPADLIDLRHFFASSEANWGYRVSPDGARLGWITSHRGRATVHVRTLGQDDVRPIRTNPQRTLHWFRWAADSRRLLYLEDRNGDENYHVYVVSSDRPNDLPLNVTPEPGSRAAIHRVLRNDPQHIIVSWNKRDRSVFDLYRVNLDTGAHVLIGENPGDVVEWLTDWDGRPRARIRHVGPDERHLELLRDGGWVVVQRYDLEEFHVQMLGVTPDDGIWLLTSHQRDRRSLVRLDIATGAETLLFEDPQVDIEWVVMGERRQAPLVAVTYPGRQALHFLDAALGRDLVLPSPERPTGQHILSLDDEERLVTVEVFTEKGYESHLVDRRTGQRTVLGRSPMLAFAHALGTTEPVTLTARDGVHLHGYLTRPPDYRAPGPLVLVVHGGHWTRDYWGYSSPIQFLANRGYAVLQVNYRGSTGYGRAFRELAVGQYGRKMHDDLIDAVHWAVQARIADRQRVAIYGGSYGGYAALVGMTFTPEVFACGVAVVAVTNWVSLYESAPPYWKLTWVPRFHKYVGDPRRPEDRRRLESISPLFKADQARRPILMIHGAADSRVSVRESEQMVAALRQAGKDVRYVTFPDEGHRWQYGNWRNTVRHYAEVEDFLSGCLGGRSSGALKTAR